MSAVLYHDRGKAEVHSSVSDTSPVRGSLPRHQSFAGTPALSSSFPCCLTAHTHLSGPAYAP
eukprot:51111-Eustigmatos_ZCMA.PRE.1